MNSTVAIILAGVLLGTVQLAVGLILGRYLPLGRRPVADPPADPETLRDFLRRLAFLVHTMNEDVGQHRAEVGSANQKLASVSMVSSSQSVETVLHAVSEVLQANQRLYDRLASAEAKLQEQARQIETYVSEARTDPLTTLANRRAFDDELRRRLAEWQRKGHPFCVLLADVDHFKQINDQLGHTAGDEVLAQLGALLQHTVRGMDVAARVGGEEFGVILPGTDARAGRLAAERIRWAVEEHPFRAADRPLSVTVSVGITQVLPEDDAASLMQRADQALYQSKRAGRNCSHYHDGQTCVPAAARHPGLPASGASEAAAPGPSRPLPPDPELDSLAADLRTRLQQLAEDAP